MGSPKPVASVTIRKPSMHSKNFRRQVAGWLRKTAKEYEKDGNKYANATFVARCFYEGNAGGPDFQR